MSEYCPECGAEVNKDYKFCVKCGKEVGGEVSDMSKLLNLKKKVKSLHKDGYEVDELIKQIKSLDEEMRTKKLMKPKKVAKTSDTDNIEQFFLDSNSSIQTSYTKCPICGRSVKVEIDFSKKLKEIETECPSCRIPLKIGNISKSKLWWCEHCGKQFQTKEEAERHEEKCEHKNWI